MAIRRFIIATLLLGSMVLLICDRVVARAAEHRIYAAASEIPPDSTAVVLGTSKFFHGRANAFYDARIQAVIELYRSGKLSHIILSGAGRSPEGDEPEQMRQDLLAA